MTKHDFFKQVIFNLRDYGNKRLSSIAEKMGVTRQYLSNILHGHLPLTSRVLNGLLRSIDIPPLVVELLTADDCEKMILRKIIGANRYDEVMAKITQYINDIT